MRPQIILNQFEEPHHFAIYDILGRKLIDYDPILHTVKHKSAGCKTIVFLNNIEIRRLVYSANAKVIFEYDPETEIIYLKSWKILTEIKIKLLRKKYREFRNLARSLQ